jgi:arylsulfatase A-like enzyme
MPLLYQYGEMFWDTRSFLLAAHAYDVANYRFFFDSPQLDRLYYQEMSGHPAYNSVGMDDRYVVEAFEAEMAALAPEQRFFGVLHLNGTHYPYNVPPAFRQWGGGTPLDDYDNAILYQDHNIGRVLERLRADGRLDNTVVIMTSDHGEGFGEHGINGHRSGFFEEMLNVPLWMLLPSELAGRYGAVLRENAALPASNVDLAPTLIDLLGLDAVPVVAEVVATLRGSSLVRPLPPGRTILAQNGDQATAAAEGFAVIQGQRRFLHHRIYARMHTQLFDLDTDPAQQVNLWGDLSPAERQALLDVLMHVQPIRRIVASLTAETQ